MIQIKHKDKTIYNAPIKATAIHHKELMTDEYIRVSFNETRLIDFPIGSYIEYEGGKYELLKPYTPEQVDELEYRYNIEFKSLVMRWGGMDFSLVTSGIVPEIEWNIRGDAKTVMKTVIDTIKHHTGLEYEYVIDDGITGTRFIEFNNTTIHSGLNQIAEAFETEWWVEGYVIHLSKCERGEYKNLVVGENVGVPKIEDDQEYFNRIIPFGSDRNIQQDYEGAYISSKKRLTLNPADYPNGYIDFSNGEQVVPKVVVFEDIYPKSYLTISEVSQEVIKDRENEQTYYKVKLKDFTLTQDLIMEGEVPKMAFESGLLYGADFELNVDEWLTLIPTEEGNRTIPNDILKPKVGDAVILWNIKMPDRYIVDAQKELEEESLKVIRLQKENLKSYSVNTYATSFDYDIEVGDRVRLNNKGEILESRVYSKEAKLDTPTSMMLTIGNKKGKGFFDKLVEELSYNSRIVNIGSGSAVHLIKEFDRTYPTDHNTFSAKRADRRFLRKDSPDKTEHLIRLLGGVAFNDDKGIDKEGNALLDVIRASKVTAEEIEALVTLTAKDLKAITAIINQATTLNLIVEELAKIHNLTVKDTASLVKTIVSEYISSPTYVSGMMGEGFKLYQAINGDWNLELDNLTVRKVFSIFEIVVQKIRYQGGIVLHSAAGGVITKVTDLGDAWKCEHDGIDDFAVGDQVLCQVFKVKQGEAKVKRYWRLATDAGKGYVTLSKTDAEKGSAIPEVGDEIIQLGNRTNTARQSAYDICVIGDNAPYTAYYSGINSYSLEGKQHTRIGNLSGITDKDFGALSGNGIYSQNAFLKGIFRLSNGKTIERAIEETTEYLGSSIDNVKLELQSNILETESNFNSNLSSVKSELNSSINQAQQTAENAQSAIDGVQFGVRNLLRYRKDNGFSFFAGGSSTNVTVDGDIIRGVSNAATPGWPRIHNTSIELLTLDLNSHYTLSFKARSSVKADREAGIATLNGSTVISRTTKTIDTEWTEIIHTFKPQTQVVKGVSFYVYTGERSPESDTTNWVEIKEVMLVKGNKAPVDWTAAPEDMQQTLQKELTQVRTDFEIREGQISGKITEATNLVEESKTISGETKQTLIETTSRINQFNITAKEFESTLGEITKKQNEVEGSISEVNQTAKGLSLTVEGFKETEREIKDTASRIESTHEGIVLEASEKSAQKAIDGLEIGGRNYFSPSKVNDTAISGSTNNGTIIANRYYKSFYIAVKKNETWSLSRSEIGNANRFGYTFSIDEPLVGISVGGGANYWKDLKVEGIKIPFDGWLYIYLANNVSDVDSLPHIKLEKGNKATDWTPAPEDIEDKIETTRTEFDSKLEITKEAITATSTKVDGLTGRVQETEAKLEPDRLWVAVKDNSQKLIDDLDTVNRNYAYVIKEPDYTRIYVSNDFPRNSKQYLSLSLWGNFEEFPNIDPFDEILFGGNFDSPFLDYKYIRKSVNHIIYEGGYVDLSLETNKDLTLSLYGMAPEELITKAKIDLGTKATDWTPAPEELLTPEGIRASIELTTNGLNVFGKHHSFTGKVTFASLASDAQGKINSAQSTADSANRDLAMLEETIIDGGFIKTSLIKAGSITADKIDVDSIFAKRIQTGNIDILEGATIAGELKGVSGTFKELYVLDNRGNEAGKITFRQDGSFTFTGSVIFDDFVRFDGNIYSQGDIIQQGKTLAGDLVVRGALGYDKKAAIVISGNVAKYYYEGYWDNNPYILRPLKSVGSGGTARYEIPIHTSDDREDNGFIYNLIYFDPLGTHYKYEIIGTRIGGNPYPLTPNIGYEVTLANVNNSNNNVSVFINGAEKRWDGGAIGKLNFIGKLQQPNALDRVGGGWLLEYFYDNNW